jgi:hypothetical protein
VRRFASFSSVAIPGTRHGGGPGTLLRHGCDSPPRSARINNREPKKRCRQQFCTGKANLRGSASSRGRFAKVRFMGRVCGGIIQHRIQRCRQRLKLYDAGKNGPIANLRVNHECRTLSDLQRMKLRR